MRIIGKCLYGSQNLSLNGPQSDEDYKVFVMPEFIDLYKMKKGNKMSLPIGYDSEHNSAIDFRNFDSHLREANANMIECLFSIKQEFYDTNLKNYFLLGINAYKNQYVAYKWKEFFSCVKGLVMNSLKRYDNSNENRLKATSRGIWWINFMSYIIEHDFIIDSSAWEDCKVWKFPRRVRYSGEDYQQILTQEDWEMMFAHVELIAYRRLKEINYNEFLFKQYENQLMICAQNIVKDSLMKELEGES